MYTCQRCARPLALAECIARADDGELERVRARVAELRQERLPHDKLARLAYIDAPEIRAALSSAIDTAESPPPPRRAPALFDALSEAPGDPPIDHPLCRRCADAVVAHLSDDTQRLLHERDVLERAAAAVGRAPPPSPGDTHTTYQGAERKLCEIDEAHAALARDAAALAAEEEALARAEEAAFHAHTDAALRVRELENMRAALDTKEKRTREQTARLDGTDAYADVFDIDTEGACATINGLRVARSSRETVGWPELNAALGQVALLVVVLARRMGVVFDEYRVVPHGSTSRVERLGADGATFELYGTSEWHLGRLLHARRFDQALVGLLACVHQLAEHAARRDETLQLPYTCVCAG